MKVNQNSDIRGLEFLNCPKANIFFDKKKIDELKSLSKPNLSINQHALKLFEEEYNNLGHLPFEISPQEYNYLINHKEELHFSYLVYRYEFKLFPKKKINSLFPCYVLIEPVSSCNLKCGMCFQSDATFIKKEFMGKMNINLYKKIIDECYKEGTKAITFGSRGEPTIHPEFKSFLTYAKNKFIDIKLITNATRLNDDLIYTIFNSNVNQVVFSVDSEKKVEYEEIRKFGKFDQVLKNIQRYNEIKKEFKNNRTITRISGVMVKDSQDPESFSKFWSNYADEVVIKPAYERWNTYLNPIDEKIKSPCSYLWERMYIWFDGKFNPCDADYKSYLSYGDLNNSSIKEAWNSIKLKQIKKQHINNNRSELNPCDRCGLY